MKIEKLYTKYNLNKEQLKIIAQIYNCHESQVEKNIESLTCDEREGLWILLKTILTKEK